MSAPLQWTCFATIAALHREIAELRRRVGLLEAFVDVRHREKAGLATDQVREIWHGKQDQTRVDENPSSRRTFVKGRPQMKELLAVGGGP